MWVFPDDVTRCCSRISTSRAINYYVHVWTAIANTIISWGHVFFVLHFNWHKVLPKKTITWSSIFFLCCRILLPRHFLSWFFAFVEALGNCLFANVLTYTSNMYISRLYHFNKITENSTFAATFIIDKFRYAERYVICIIRYLVVSSPIKCHGFTKTISEMVFYVVLKSLYFEKKTIRINFIHVDTWTSNRKME